MVSSFHLKNECVDILENILKILNSFGIANVGIDEDGDKTINSIVSVWYLDHEHVCSKSNR